MILVVFDFSNFTPLVRIIGFVVVESTLDFDIKFWYLNFLDLMIDFTVKDFITVIRIKPSDSMFPKQFDFWDFNFHSLVIQFNFGSSMKSLTFNWVVRIFFKFELLVSQPSLLILEDSWVILIIWWSKFYCWFLCFSIPCSQDSLSI